MSPIIDILVLMSQVQKLFILRETINPMSKFKARVLHAVPIAFGLDSPNLNTLLRFATQLVLIVA